MLYDVPCIFSDGQAIVTSAASANHFDAGISRDLGRGHAPYLHVRVDESVTAAGAATVTFQLQTDDDPGFGSAVTLMSTRAIGKAELYQGYDVFAVPLVPGVKRYLRVYYVVATGPLTAGKFTAALGENPAGGGVKFYPRAAVARV